MTIKRISMIILIIPKLLLCYAMIVCRFLDVIILDWIIQFRIPYHQTPEEAKDIGQTLKTPDK